MTAGAREFVSPMTFRAVSDAEVRSDLWDEDAERAMSHIELARWASLVLVAPATADFIAHLAHGLADNLLTTVCLATEAPLAIAPAMNRQMWMNAATQANIATLRARGVHVFGPDSGSQACGETGEGRMMEPADIAAAASGVLPATGPLVGRKVLITAGPTRERIDPVRFISNRSSGKMGYAVARAARALGAEVVLVSGPVSLCTPSGVRRVDVESAAQMHDTVMHELPGTDIFIATAAVADYRPAAPADCKIKKVSDTLEISMERTITSCRRLRAT
jgi:phosphopantothenoylcysteine decarboxylase/phosphopantothenate--cysteine ligase